MSKHTPGPWRAEYNTVQVGEGLDWEPIADVFAPNDDRATITANINLIAAAPEMLEALKMSADQIAFSLARLAELRGVPSDELAAYVERNTTLIAVRAAIAKAEGRQP